MGKLTEEQKRDQVCFEDCFTKNDLKAIFRQRAGSLGGCKKLTSELIFKLDDLVSRIYREKKAIKEKELEQEGEIKKLKAEKILRRYHVIS